MPLKSSIEKKLIWDQYANKMVTRSEVKVWIETNLGTILFEEGPLYCETTQDAFWAFSELKERLFRQATTSTGD
jgi:hypothetical protein